MNAKNSSPFLPKAFGLSDFIYIGVCIIVALIALFFFWADLNQTLTRMSEQPVGTITYKYRAAQRRFEDRVLWDRLKQESPVYAGDYIRTAELSQATVSLYGSGIITLKENTLVQIPKSRKLPIGLTSGSLSVDARSGSVSIKTGDTVIDAVSGSLLQTSAMADGIDVRVLEGNAEIRGKNGQVSASAGDVYSSGRSGDSPDIAVLFPRPAAKLLNHNEIPLSVDFRWNRINFPNNETVTLDVAEDRNFTRIVASIQSLSGGARAELPNGTYYWRAYPSSEASAEEKQAVVGDRLSVVQAQAPRLMRPLSREVFRFSTTRPGVRFQWTACEGAMAYLVEVADNQSMGNMVYQSQVQAAGNETGSIVHSGFESGTYYWRVTPVYSSDFEGTPLASALSSFQIEKAVSLAAPEVIGGQKIAYLEGPEGKIYFSWKQEDEAASYVFLLSQQEDLSQPIIIEKIRNNYFAFDLKASDLSPGQYYWGVYQVDMVEAQSVSSEVLSLLVLEGVPPQRIPVPGIAAAPAVAAVVEAPPPAAVPVETPPRRPPPPPAETNVRERVPPVEPPPARPSAPAAIETPPVRAPVETPVETPVSEPPPAAVTQTIEQPPEPRRLSSPANLRPATGYILTEAIILRDKRINFSWNPVNAAASYVFSIYQGDREVLRRTLQTTSYALTDLSVLDEGSFTWRVQAVPANQNTFLPSDISENRFIVKLSEVQAAEGKQGGLMFGTE